MQKGVGYGGVRSDPTSLFLQSSSSAQTMTIEHDDISKGFDGAQTAAQTVETHAPSSEAQEAAQMAGQGRDVAQAAEQMAEDPSAERAAGLAQEQAQTMGAPEEAQRAAETAQRAAETAEMAAESGAAVESAVEAESPADIPAEPAVESESPVEASATEPPPAEERSAAPAERESPAAVIADFVEEEFRGLVGERLHPVHYEFYLLSGPDIACVVMHYEMSEELGEAYQFEIDVAIYDIEAPLEELLGARCELLIDRHVGMRAVYGVISEFYERGSLQDRLFVHIVVVPALRLLEQEVDTRIFQGMDVKEILTEILTPCLQAYHRDFDIENCLKESYNKRDYCVQFRESTLDFCCRIIAEEGMTFRFEADEENRAEKLIFVDNNASYGPPNLVIDDDIPLIPDRFTEADRESIQAFQWKKNVQPNKVVARGFNAKAPDSLDESTHDFDGKPSTPLRSIYIHGERRQIIEDIQNDDPAESFTGEELDQRERLGKLTLEQFIRQSKVFRGTSNITDLRPGVTITLGELPQEDLDGHQFLVTLVTHHGDVPGAQAGGGDGEPQYRNNFECIPVEHAFRPEQRRREPQILTAQTATVVGPPNEEIYTDRLGRVRVRFHWEHVVENERSSCWIRVVQPWAGPGWGFMFIPRVGMEVLVHFLDGNPDRPIITGSVYNGTNLPPYTLPDERTKSVIKTSSSPGGDGYNELTFEDAAGSEQIIVHAQKDFNETTENDHTTTVHANETNTVDVNQTNHVGGDQATSIDGEQTLTVGKNRIVTIEASHSVTINGKEAVEGHSGSKLAITGDYKVDASNQIDVQAPTHIKFECGGSSILIEPGKITLSAGGKAEMVLDANALIKASSGTNIKLDANALMKSSGSSEVKLDGDALMKSSGGSQMKLDANALTQSSGGAKVQLDSSALMFGPSSATVNGPTATLAGGGGSVEAAAAGVKVATGAKVDVSGSMVGISGAIVKIN